MKLPMQPSGKRSYFFEHESLDHMMTMIIELASELAITRERVFALESVLSRTQTNLVDEVESWEANEVEAEKLEAIRMRMLNEIFRTLGIERAGPSDETVVAIAS